MKHAHVVRRRKEVADSGAAVGEGKRVLTVYPLFSLQAGGAKRKAHKRETPKRGAPPQALQGAFEKAPLTPKL